MEKLTEPLAAESGWSEVNAPELVAWKTPGDTITGVLMQVATIQLKGKNVTQYTLMSGDRKFKLLATYDLFQKIGREHLGCAMRIKYRGENPEVSGGSSNTPMKVFSVQIKGTPSTATHGGPITDEDIPF